VFGCVAGVCATVVKVMVIPTSCFGDFGNNRRRLSEFPKCFELGLRPPGAKQDGRIPILVLVDEGRASDAEPDPILDRAALFVRLSRLVSRPGFCCRVDVACDAEVDGLLPGRVRTLGLRTAIRV
jgi:hypothetical protein